MLEGDFMKRLSIMSKDLLCKKESFIGGGIYIMWNISNTFRLAVNANKNRIRNILMKRYRELSELPVNGKRFILNNNKIELNYNEDFDKAMSISEEDAYLYYEYNMDFYPKEKELSLEVQIAFAKELAEIFRGSGVEVEIISEFEHLLDD